MNYTHAINNILALPDSELMSRYALTRAKIIEHRAIGDNWLYHAVTSKSAINNRRQANNAVRAQRDRDYERREMAKQKQRKAQQPTFDKFWGVYVKP